MVSDEAMEAALLYLSETDEEFANLKYTMEALSTKKDLVEKEVFLHETGNVEERKSASRVHESTKEAAREYLHAMREFEKMKNQRHTAETKIWIWKALQRSGNANV